MGVCCGAASDVTDDEPLEVPPRGRPELSNTLPAEDHGLSHYDTHYASATAGNREAKSKSKKGKQESFTALGTLDSQERRLSGPSRKSSDSASMTNGCTPTRTTTAALSHPGGLITNSTTTATSVAAKSTAALAMEVGQTVPPSTTPTTTTTPSIYGTQHSHGSQPNVNSREGNGGDGLLSDVFHISESSLSSSSSSSAVVDHDALSTSLVEVSQATQTIRQHDRTHSEFDATSEWAETSMDRTAGRRRSQSRLFDRNRLQHLLMTEAEGRASLLSMYVAQHRRALVRCVKEQFIDQRVLMLRAHQAERTAMCAAWLTHEERAAREVIAREWWMERAALAWRTSVASNAVAAGSATGASPAALHAATATTLGSTAAVPSTASASAAPPAAVNVVMEPSFDMGDHAKRDDSLVHMSSHTGREEALSSSEETAEEDTAAGMRSPSVRFTGAALACAAPTVNVNAQKAFSAPCASRLALTDSTRSPSTAADTSMTATTTAVAQQQQQQPYTQMAPRKVSSAQQALRDRMVRGRKPVTEASESL